VWSSLVWLGLLEIDLLIKPHKSVALFILISEFIKETRFEKVGISSYIPTHERSDMIFVLLTEINRDIVKLY
jgi:hypothetical protein